MRPPLSGDVNGALLERLARVIRRRDELDVGDSEAHGHFGMQAFCPGHPRGLVERIEHGAYQIRREQFVGGAGARSGGAVGHGQRR